MKRTIVRAALGACTAIAVALLAALAQAAPGSLDPSFGSGGLVTTDVGGNDFANAVSIQADGRIVVAGQGAGAFVLARFAGDGNLDAGFGTGGIVSTDFTGGGDAFDLAIQPDAKIVAAGASSQNFALARFNPDGSLDTSFGAGGKVTTDFGGLDSAFGLAAQGDGKLVAAGQVPGGFGLARYNSDGSLDTGFGSSGRVTTSFASGGSATSVGLQADGKIVAAGNSGGDFTLARYNPDGSPDTSFGNGGKLTTDFGGVDNAIDVAIQPDGKIVAAGISDASVGDFALARYNPDGSLDTSFGSGGKVTTDFAGNRDVASAVTTLGDGKIVAAGGATLSAGDSAFALARYNVDGSLDTGFGSAGKTTTNVTPASDGANDVALQADGRIVAVGFGSVGAGIDFALVRYLGDSASGHPCHPHQGHCR